MAAIDPEQWEALDESDRLELVLEFHQVAGIEVPDMETHAVLHCVIENQIAMEGELPVATALQRLLEEGLDRHDAIHAVASVLANHLHEFFHGEDAARTHDDYFAEISELTAKKLQCGP